MSRPGPKPLRGTPFGHRVEGHQLTVLQLVPAQGWRLVRLTETPFLELGGNPTLEEISELSSECELHDLITTTAIAAFALIEYQHSYGGAEDASDRERVHILQDTRPVAAVFDDSPALDVLDEHSYLALLGPGDLVDAKLRVPAAVHLAATLAPGMEGDEEEWAHWLRAIYSKHGVPYPWHD